MKWANNQLLVRQVTSGCHDNLQITPHHTTTAESQDWQTSLFHWLTYWSSGIPLGFTIRTIYLPSMQQSQQRMLGAFRQQSIIWINVDRVLRHHMASPGHNELTVHKYKSRNCPRLPIPSIITTWWGITCRIAVTIEVVENAYLPGNVHFQYWP